MNVRIYDGDTHIVEPPALWQDRVPTKFKALAPRWVKNDDGSESWVYEDGRRVSPVAGMMAPSGTSPVTWDLYSRTTYGEIRRGAYDPEARLHDMDTDFVYAHVLHPTLALSGPTNFSRDNVELQLVCTRAYNDWMSEFCSTDLDRLIGLALLPISGIEDTIAELERVRDLPGIDGVLLTAWPNGRATPLPEDDKFWAAAAAADMPVVLHVGITGSSEQDAFMGFMKLGDRSLVLGHINLERTAHAIMEALSYIIIGGVLQRHPALTIVGTETGIGWIPVFLEQTDDNFRRHRFWAETELTMLPSEYYRRQCFNTFQVDRAGILARDGIVENIVWSSDFPHTGADWPNSTVTIEHNLVGVPEDERRLILTENCRRAFRLA